MPPLNLDLWLRGAKLILWRLVAICELGNTSRQEKQRFRVTYSATGWITWGTQDRAVWRYAKKKIIFFESQIMAEGSC